MNFRPLLFPSHAYENGPSKTVDFRNFFLRRYYFRGERGVIVTRGGGRFYSSVKITVLMDQQALLSGVGPYFRCLLNNIIRISL